MIIKALVENTSISKNYKSVHGLSLYIETEKHKLLFDLGPGKLFYENALKMNINIEDIDTVVISHGHYDHGGGMKTFLEHNNKAKIYLSETAFLPYFTSAFGMKYYIGLNQALKENDRIIYAGNNTMIDEELLLFSGVTERSCIAKVKHNLYQKVKKKYVEDTFRHEQSLLIRENGNSVLVGGCAHAGIVNILNKGMDIAGEKIDTVISGFHLYELSLKKEKNQRYLDELAATLSKESTKFLTCHCTGKRVYDYLHEKMGEQIGYLSTGASITI